MPMDVGPGGNLEWVLAYGNHSRASKHVADVSENAVRDVKKGEMRRLLQLSKLHLNRQEKRGKGRPGEGAGERQRQGGCYI